MPQFCTGDMWTAFDEADLFLITTNSRLRQDGRLVMGRGIARQVRERFPGLGAALGAQIQTVCGNLGFYGLLVSRRWPAARLGAFQVKRHWQQAADLSLITRSVTALTWWAQYHDDYRIHLNFSGIGNGGLARAAVLPLLAPLPNNITIWEYTALLALNLKRAEKLQNVSCCKWKITCSIYWPLHSCFSTASCRMVLHQLRENLVHNLLY